MDPFSPFTDYHSGKSAELLTRQLVWRERWAAVRHYGFPVAVALGIAALWLTEKCS